MLKNRSILLDKHFFLFVAINLVTSLMLIPYVIEGYFIKSIVVMLTAILCFYLIIDFIAFEKIKNAIKIILSILVIPIGFLDLFCIINFQTKIVSGLTINVFLTNPSESLNFLTFYGSMPKNIILLIVYPVACVLLFIIPKKYYMIKIRYIYIYYRICGNCRIMCIPKKV